MNIYSNLEIKMYELLIGRTTLSTFLVSSQFKNNSHKFEQQLADERFIFISGLPRAGSTILLEVINSIDGIGSLYYGYLPFILIPRLADYFYRHVSSKLKTKKERSHKDGIEISQSSPECLDEIYWLN